MDKPTSRQLVTPLISIAALVLLLIVGGMLAWRGQEDAVPNEAPDSNIALGSSAGQIVRLGIPRLPPEPITGPVGKITAWIEPPRSKYEVDLSNTDLFMQVLYADLTVTAERDLTVVKVLEDARRQLDAAADVELTVRAALSNDAVLAPWDAPDVKAKRTTTP